MSILKAEISYEIMKLLELHCSKGEDGYADYEKGWNDARIARKAKVGVGSVAHRRKMMFGHLRDAGPGRKPEAPSKVREDIKCIEDALFSILKNQATMNRRILHLYKQLGEKVPDEGEVDGAVSPAAA